MDETQAERSYRLGTEYPYDGSREDRDWADHIARGILYDLCDRRGVGHELYDVDDDVRSDITDAIADIVRVGKPDLMPPLWSTGDTRLGVEVMIWAFVTTVMAGIALYQDIWWVYSVALFPLLVTIGGGVTLYERIKKCK